MPKRPWIQRPAPEAAQAVIAAVMALVTLVATCAMLFSAGWAA
jgi:ABC-type transport system involved in cytochrome bd biosynthesis fused ATPase/permease subunit